MNDNTDIEEIRAAVFGFIVKTGDKKFLKLEDALVEYILENYRVPFMKNFEEITEFFNKCYIGLSPMDLAITIMGAEEAMNGVMVPAGFLSYSRAIELGKNMTKYRQVAGGKQFHEDTIRLITDFFQTEKMEKEIDDNSICTFYHLRYPTKTGKTRKFILVHKDF